MHTKEPHAKLSWDTRAHAHNTLNPKPKLSWDKRKHAHNTPNPKPKLSWDARTHARTHTTRTHNLVASICLDLARQLQHELRLV